MQNRFAAGRVLSVSAVLLLALSAVSCGGKGDNANANGAANANRANTNVVSNMAAPATDAALKNRVEANLTKYNVSGVTVEVANGEVTLKGNIARAKLSDAMKAANEADPKKVNNQMNIQ
ncbi:MAG: hyperosmotically inducible periplasmic protein [Acidobacteriota bacterium]|jgi:osmotically-inducible protein OsmY|nr:hyperosmotically inducible periplasmic protein [Acidobacteriota bacterium]